MKSITRSAWSNTFHYINTKLTWYHASIFNSSVNNKTRAGIPSTLKVQTFHLVTSSTTQRGTSTPHHFSDQQLYGPTKYFPSRFLTRSASKTSNNKCLKTCSPALMCLLYRHVRQGQSGTESTSVFGSSKPQPSTGQN